MRIFHRAADDEVLERVPVEGRKRYVGRRVVLPLIVALLAAWVAARPVQAGTMATSPATTTVTVHGLEILLDNGTGTILQLRYAGLGNLIDADAADAGLVDVAYPIEAFEPLRLAARHSRAR